MKISFLNKDGKPLDPKGCLHNFIKEEIDNYVPPSRKGTPRGKMIGFSIQKHAACVLALTSWDLKDIKKQLGVSYGLLRKWRTETEFRKEVFRHASLFSNLFWASATQNLEDSLPKANSQGIIEDAQLMGVPALFAVVNSFKNNFRSENPVSSVLEDILLTVLSTKAIGHRMEKKVRETRERFLSSHMIRGLNLVSALLRMPKISEKSKEKAIELLAMVSSYIKERSPSHIPAKDEK